MPCICLLGLVSTILLMLIWIAPLARLGLDMASGNKCFIYWFKYLYPAWTVFKGNPSLEVTKAWTTMVKSYWLKYSHSWWTNWRWANIPGCSGKTKSRSIPKLHIHFCTGNHSQCLVASPLGIFWQGRLESISICWPSSRSQLSPDSARGLPQPPLYKLARRDRVGCYEYTEDIPLQIHRQFLPAVSYKCSLIPHGNICASQSFL